MRRGGICVRLRLHKLKAINIVKIYLWHAGIRGFSFLHFILSINIIPFPDHFGNYVHALHS